MSNEQSLDREARREAAKARIAAKRLTPSAELPAPTPTAPPVAPKATTAKAKLQETVTKQSSAKGETLRVDSIQSKVDESQAYIKVVLDDYLAKMRPNGIISPEEGGRMQMRLLNLIGRTLRNEDMETYSAGLDTLLAFIAKHKDTYFDGRHSHRFFDMVASQLSTADQFRKSSDLFSAFIKLAPKNTRRLIVSQLPSDSAFGMLKEDARNRFIDYLSN